MESTAFIRQASVLIRKIKDYQLMAAINTSGPGQGRQFLQKEVTQLFASLGPHGNYTLPSVARLRDAAQEAGLIVAQQVDDRIEAAEACWR